ncbi:MAG: restriction endonuclease [Opitutales bacterium]|nr:restriction endonuclease [Opitutales bacterium]
MPKREESIAVLLVKAPWWIAASLAVIFFIAMRWIIPAFPMEEPLLQLVSQAAEMFAPYALIGFMVLAFFSWIHSFRKRKLLAQQDSLESLKQLSWKEFEFLVSEAYRQKGYEVEESLGGGADGGVDLIFRKDGQKTLVQCKRWKTRTVGAPIVREIYGLMVSEGADRATVVISGRFTQEAKKFAEGKPLDLVNGEALLDLIKSVQTPEKKADSLPKQEVDPLPETAKVCGRCGAEMVKRTARKGPNTGQSFWGCSTYPKCRHTEKVG